MFQEYDDRLEKMVRDFTQITTRMKSEVRQRISDYAFVAFQAGIRQGKQEAKKEIFKALDSTEFGDKIESIIKNLNSHD